MKRRATLAAVFSVAAAGVLVGALTRTDRAAAQPRSVQEVVAQVRREFGDQRIVRAKIDGSSLHVIVASPKPTTPKGEFEASVLAAAVADWMRSHGRKPIERVRAFGGVTIGGRLEGDPVPSAPAGSVSRDTCESAAKAAVGASEASVLISVSWLSYLHGTCAVRIRTTIGPGVPQYEVGAAGVQVAGLIVSKIGLSAVFYFEVDDDLGSPLVWSARLPTWGSNGAAAGIPNPFVHG